MEKVQKVAVFCTARAVFLASVMIYIVMMFFSSDPGFAFKAGSILTVVMAGVLVWKARFVMRQEPSSTEVWIYLDEGTRRRSKTDRDSFAATLRNVYGRFAKHTLAVACIMFVISAGILSIGGQAAQETLHAGVN
jgi:hypothetical protein